MAGDIVPFLWFDDKAEEAARFYASIFPDSHIDSVSRYGEAGPGAPGSAMTVAFTLRGRPYVALNGGPVFKFNPAVSFVVDCENQAEVDRYWSLLSADSEKGQCGWLTDKYGLSWQIVPVALGRLLGDPDPGRAKRATEAMLKMKKLVIAELEAAADGRGSVQSASSSSYVS
jgi:predicted 3-demethylubiquinone-9 3-methyltransferase (glyoxalase superfamily)